MNKRTMALAVLGTLGLAFGAAAADHGLAVGVPTNDRARLQTVATNDDKDHGEKFHWVTGTITAWDQNSHTFTLRDTAHKNKGQVLTFTVNEKTMVEGMDAKVGQHAKVKYTDKGGVNLAHHVFVGQRAIKEHKQEKAAENPLSQK